MEWGEIRPRASNGSEEGPTRQQTKQSGGSQQGINIQRPHTIANNEDMEIKLNKSGNE